MLAVRSSTQASILESLGEIPGLWRSPGSPVGFRIILHLSEKRKERTAPRALSIRVQFSHPRPGSASCPQGGEAWA